MSGPEGIRGVLTIYTNQPSGNLVHKHKTIKFDVVGELLNRYKLYSNQTKKGRKIASPKITANIF